MSKTEEQKAPLLSVIIPTLNRAHYIERCLLSVFHEIETDYPNTEVIVIDGGSTDGTVEILKRYDDRIAYWISEPDTGISQAVNKGITEAKGEVIRFLGDDDELNPGWFRHMIGHLLEHPEIDILIGHADFYLEDASGVITSHSVKQPVGRITFKDLLRIGEIGWPSPEVAFTRRSVFEKYGGYDTRYHYLAYLEIWLRFAKNGVVLEAIPQVITKRYLTVHSDTMTGGRRIIEEKDEIFWIYGGISYRTKKRLQEKNKQISLMKGRFLGRDLWSHFLYWLYQLLDSLNIYPRRTLRRVFRRLRSLTRFH